MSGRNIRARLDRLTKALGEQQPAGPVCRFHNVHCRMGANWPLKREPQPEDDLLDLLADAQRSVGKVPAPHPRDVWATDTHELVPLEELARERREAEELLAAARARNDQIEAGLRAGRADSGGTTG